MKFSPLRFACLLIPLSALPATASPLPAKYQPGSSLGGVRVSPTSYLAVTGIAFDQPSDRIFHLRNHRGHIFTIDLMNFAKSWKEVPQTGRLTVYGLWKNDKLCATNLRYDDGLYGSRAHSEAKEIPTHLGIVTGMVLPGGDSVGFDLLGADGGIYSVVIGRLNGGISYNEFRPGSRIRVYGEISVVDGVDQIEATHVAFLKRVPIEAQLLILGSDG